LAGWRRASREWCPSAEALFCGHNGELIGVTFSYARTAVLPEAAWVSAHLPNVDSLGAVVLRGVARTGTP
jgi:hypothetical protein